MSVTAPDGSVWPEGSLRALEHQSIRNFVRRAAEDGYLSGRVLDYGCGTAPYRGIVEGAGGEWHGFDRAEFPDNRVGDIGEPLTFGNHYDAVLFTQVAQYSFETVEILTNIGFYALNRKGILVMTYPTNWPEAQESDLCRFTAAGMERLLKEAGFEIMRHERRAEIVWHGETLALGYGVIARA